MSLGKLIRLAEAVRPRDKGWVFRSNRDLVVLLPAPVF